LSAIAAPRIGLLNIGEEDIKGHETVREAHALLQQSSLNYIGFVEGDDIFSGRVDVVVTDGFTGNVALKTMEGLARMVGERTRREFATGWGNRLAALLARPSLRRLAQDLDPRRYNGACMVGLGGVVVKSHGRADTTAFARAVELAATLGRGDLCAQIGQEFERQGR
jgi:phosphate acyltransferase